MIPTYVSVSIRGDNPYTQQFLYSIRDMLPTIGCDLLDPHVLELDSEKRANVFHDTSGIDIANSEDVCGDARFMDFHWVNQAQLLIALADGSGSDGRGMEVQRAIDKPAMGLNDTHILIVRQRGTEDTFSCMVQGVRDNPLYSVQYYSDIDDLKSIITSHVKQTFG